MFTDDDDEGLVFESDMEDGSDEEGDQEELGEEEEDDEDDDEEGSDLGSAESDEIYSSGTEGDEETEEDDAEDETAKDVAGPSPKPVKKPTKSPSLNKLQEEIKKDETPGGSVVPSKGKEEYDEYAEDTSDEEDIRNTVGNIPMQWYDEYKHIGYDWDAKKIIKPPKRDQLDDFLKRMEDPDFWRTVKDPQTGQEVILTDEDIELIKRINSQKIPDKNFNEYAPWIDWFSSEVEKMPISNIPDHKRSFIPSKSEKKKIGRLVHSIKMGYLKSKEETEKAKAKKGPSFYMLWDTDTDGEKMRRIHDHVSAPKRDLPGHAESYNPPEEYLFNEREMKEWNKMETTPYKRKLHFLPQKFKSLRQVPAYSRYLRERFLRCLDLYLCPRAKRMKLTIGAEYLIPKLPSPKDLQPFPTTESLIYKGHTDIIRTISIEPKGEYIVTGSDDTTIKSKLILQRKCHSHSNLLFLHFFSLGNSYSALH